MKKKKKNSVTLSVGSLIKQQAVFEKAYKTKTNNGQREWYRCGDGISNIHHNTIMMIFEFFQDRGYMVVRQEQKLYHPITLGNKDAMLLGKVDAILMNPYTRRLCLLELKTSTLPKEVDINYCFLRTINELQLRLYAMMLFHRLKLDYPPEIYILGIRGNEAALYKLPNKIENIVELKNVFSLNPYIYAIPY